MAALIKSGYRGYRYIMYEIAGKKIKVYTVLRKKKQIKANKADFIRFTSTAKYLVTQDEILTVYLVCIQVNYI